VADPPQIPLQFQHHWFSEEVGSEEVPIEQRSELGLISQSLPEALPHCPFRVGIVPGTVLVFPQLLVWVSVLLLQVPEGSGVQGLLGLVPVQVAPQELV